MLLSTLKTVAAAYMQKEVVDLTKDGVDLFLEAANNVRQQAELLHDFEYARTTALLNVNGVVGTDLSEARVGPSATKNYTVTGGMGAGTYYPCGLYSNYPLFLNPLGFALWYDGSAWRITTLADLGNVNANAWLHGPSAMPLPFEFYLVAITGLYSNPACDLIVQGAMPKWKGIKSVVNASTFRRNFGWMPLEYSRADVAIERDRYINETNGYNNYLRYPGDGEYYHTRSRSLIQTGSTVALNHFDYECATDGYYLVKLEVNGFLRDYVAADLTDVNPTDFLLEFGGAYMKWAVLCELNYLFQAFLSNRTEGSLPSPTNEREAAWAKLIVWDTYLVDGATTYSR